MMACALRLQTHFWLETKDVLSPLITQIFIEKLPRAHSRILNDFNENQAIKYAKHI